MIVLEGISKKYLRRDGTPVNALLEVSLQIHRGEFVALRGASGSGKSSLLNIIGGLDSPTAGTYRLNGHELSSYSDRELSQVRSRAVGFIFQSFNLLPRTTALENVELPMIYADAPVDRERAMAALARVGLAGRSDHYATELSGGEQQRVALARALINSPALILADEPTGNLDAVAGAEVMSILVNLHQEGRTIVLVTHDDATAAHARREVLLDQGRIVSDRTLGAAPAVLNGHKPPFQPSA
jgi:putative ABC transport system ATP-binding protein